MDTSKMLQVFRIPVAKDKLKALSSDERVLLILLGYVSNQLMMMQKLLVFSINQAVPSEEEAIEVAQGVQTQMLLRLMIGLLNEAWNVIATRFNQNKFNVEYRKLLDEGGLAALNELNKQFGQSNLFSKLRNSYAFHHPSSEEIESAFTSAYENVDLDASYWAYYFAQSGLNSLFLMSDFVMLHGIAAVVDEDDWSVGQAKLIAQIRSATANIVEFSKSFVVAVWQKHFGEEMTADLTIKVESAPSVEQFELPFFVAIPGEQPIEKDAVFTVRARRVATANSSEIAGQNSGQELVGKAAATSTK